MVRKKSVYGDQSVGFQGQGPQGRVQFDQNRSVERCSLEEPCVLLLLISKLLDKLEFLAQFLHARAEGSHYREYVGVLKILHDFLAITDGVARQRPCPDEIFKFESFASSHHRSRDLIEIQIVEALRLHRPAFAGDARRFENARVLAIWLSRPKRRLRNERKRLPGLFCGDSL